MFTKRRGTGKQEFKKESEIVFEHSFQIMSKKNGVNASKELQSPRWL